MQRIKNSLKFKAQTWSIDIILGVIIFLGAFLVFYAMIDTESTSKEKGLKEDAATVIKQIASEGAPLSIIGDDKINETKLNLLKNISYDELKRQFRIEGDFCIYFEDDHGYIVLINKSYRGIGSANINLSGAPCSQK